MPAAGGAAVTEIVLDTNVMGAHLFSEANSPNAHKVMAKVQGGDVVAFVPSLFWAELQQVCYQKTLPRGRRAVVSLADAEKQYQLAGTFGLAEFEGELTVYRLRAWDLVRLLGIGSYDAYFLALALDLGLPVWTFDRKFRDPVDQSALQGQVLLIGTDVTL